LVETCLPQDEQNMEGRFYQRTRPKTTLWIFQAATVTLRLVRNARTPECRIPKTRAPPAPPSRKPTPRSLPA
jgi:hypothetical protein